MREAAPSRGGEPPPPDPAGTVCCMSHVETPWVVGSRPIRNPVPDLNALKKVVPQALTRFARGHVQCLRCVETCGHGLGTAQDARSLIRAASYLMEPEPFTWLTATLLRRVRGAARAPCLDSSR